MDKIKHIEIHYGASFWRVEDNITNFAFDEDQVSGELSSGPLNRISVAGRTKKVLIEAMNQDLTNLRALWEYGGPLVLKVELLGGKQLETAAWLYNDTDLADFSNLYTDTPQSTGEKYDITITLGVEELKWLS